jgi:hypothetical protein
MSTSHPAWAFERRGRPARLHVLPRPRVRDVSRHRDDGRLSDSRFARAERLRGTCLTWQTTMRRRSPLAQSKPISGYATRERARSKHRPSVGNRRRLFAALLLLMLGVWWSLPRASASDSHHVSAPTGVERSRAHAPFPVAAPRSSLVQVPRAPILERLPAALGSSAVPISICLRAVVTLPGCDRSRALGRIHTRRRVPRMNTDDPPCS